MALKTWNGTNYDTNIGTTTLGASTSSLTVAGVTSAGFTAPNLVNATTGAWVFFTVVPTTGNAIVSLQQSTVTVVSATMNQADINLGWNYARFTVPYVFATLTASAYRVKVENDTATSGTVISGGATTLTTTATYNTATTLNANDELWVGGFHNSGMTAKTLTFSGVVANTIGSGVETSQVSGFGSSINAAMTIGTGGTVTLDKTVSTSITIRGSINAYGTGIYDGSSSTSNKAIINQTIMDNNTTNGKFGLLLPQARGGQFVFGGASYDQQTKYTSGLGTAASPMIVATAWDAAVGDEIVIGTSNDYLQNEKRFVITRNSSTSFVLSNTSGGAENALVNTHAAGVHIANMTRNCCVKPLTTTRGYKVFIQSNLFVSELGNTRYEYSSAASGHGLNFDTGNTLTKGANYDNIVLYENSLGNRNSLNIQNVTTAQTITGITAYNQLNTNTGNGAIGLSTTSNKTFTNCLVFNGANTAVAGIGLSVAVSSYKNTFNQLHIYGGNANGTAASSAIYVSSSGSNTFNNCSVNASRSQAVALSTTNGTSFNDCTFGNFSTNTIDILTVSNTQNTGVFYNCTFGSATLISNYLDQLSDSDIAFQDFNTNTSSHRWYTERGSFWSSGAGLTDTTVRTVGSLSLAIKPENNTDGAIVTFKIPANPTSQVQVYGYLYRNATFSTGLLKAELFLPGTLLTDTPDDTVTMSTDTLAWLPFVLTAYQPTNDSRYAIVVITAVTNTAGAYAFFDDIYDAGLTNKVAGLDLWDSGHISSIIVAADYSSIPDQSRIAVWNDTDTYTTGQKGLVLQDAADDAELAAIK